MESTADDLLIHLSILLTIMIFLDASRQYTVVMELFFLVTVVSLVSFSQSGVLAEKLISRSEYRALYSLRGSLGIKARDWPRKNDPCTKWNGVHCEDGRVIGLTLTGLHRTKRGNASASFAVDGLQNLTRLSTFISTDFSLPGAIPDWFGTSSLNNSLTVIDICRASINGSLPESLGYMKRLKILKLSGNQLNGVIPKNLGLLDELKVLDMSSNFLNGLIPPKLTSLPYLKSLLLSKNNLNGSIPGAIANSSILITLDLSHNNLSGPFPAELNNTQSLEFLNLGNNFLSGDLLGDIFINLPNLTSLVLSHNNFSNEIPKSLWALSNMQLIDLSYNNFSGILPNSFANLNASILHIDFSHNFYYHHLPVGSEKLFKNLRHLDISYNYFDGDIKFHKGTNVTVLQNCFTSQDDIDQRSTTECRAFYDSIGVDYDDPTIPSPTPSPSISPNSGTMIKWHWYYSLALAFVALSLVVLGLVLWKCRRHGVVSVENEIQERGFPQISSASFPSSVDSITYDKIQKATLNFNANLFMKTGHSGDLYHGNLENGTPIVVKKIDTNVAEKEMYLVELDIFTRVLHTKLAPYLGHCLANESDKYIVYKYLPNLDLATAFYIKSTQDEDEIKSLDWITRQKIAIGVAEALIYLHHECAPPIVHR